MRSLLTYLHYEDVATFALTTGTPDADYPVARLGDLYKPNSVFKGTGALVITAVLPADQDLSFVGLVNHNAGASATRRIQVYDDAAMTSQVHDSGVISLPQASEVYRTTTPYKFTEVTARAVKVTLSSQAWVIGGMPISNHLEFTDISVDRAIGFTNRDEANAQPLGADQPTKMWSPRTFTGMRDLIDLADFDDYFDFQYQTGIHRPFVWCWDYDDSDTWERQCFLATNASLPGPAKNMHASAAVSFDFEEQIG